MSVLSVVFPVVVRPWLWWTALVQLKRMAPKRWWAQAPFLPVPKSDYLEFRLVTQYGGNDTEARSAVNAADVVNYLQWCKQWNAEK